MQANLTGLKFSLDPRMGAIVAEEEPGVGGEVSLLNGDKIYQNTGFGDGSTSQSTSSFKEKNETP